MSLTNPNKVVTEQRLADFYQDIFPYLGGMPEMLANKFSRGDLYSTDEKMIGQWIDGKPIYQKTVYKSGATHHNEVLLDMSSANVDRIVGNIYATGIYPDSNQILLPYVFDGKSMCFYFNDQRKSIIFVNQTGQVLTDIILTVQYTKTTDSPISIGSDTDYSTDEKIVGTWIDGKPVYQKTVDIGSVSADGNKEYSLSGLNIDTVIKLGGSGHASYGQWVEIGFPHQMITDYGVNVLYNESNQTIVTHSGTACTLTKCYITIQYTKTTD